MEVLQLKMSQAKIRDRCHDEAHLEGNISTKRSGWT
jgi:hypothetical protein